MKKTLSTLCAVMMCMFINAQTIHWLTFIDTTDPNVGQTDVFGHQMLYSYFINEVNAALGEKGYKSDIHDYYGTAVSPENCKDAIEMLTITNPDDIIVFYYIGNGDRPITDSVYMKEHPYPQMCMAQWDSNKYIPLEWVDEQLSSKGARLSVTIGMCSNGNGVGPIMPGAVTPIEKSKGLIRLTPNRIKRIQELFLNTKGHVIAASASPGQHSSCMQIKGANQFVDRYTYAICSFFQTQLENYNEELTWDKFLNKISWFVDKNSESCQTPIHNCYPKDEKVGD